MFVVLGDNQRKMLKITASFLYFVLLRDAFQKTPSEFKNKSASFLFLFLFFSFFQLSSIYTKSNVIPLDSYTTVM
jgi:hypothetical protein